MNFDIEAYLDDALDPEARTEFEAQLTRDAALRDAVAAARRLRDDLSWLAIEKSVLPGEQAFWEKQTTRKGRNRWFRSTLVLVPLLFAGIIWWQWGKKPESVAPEQGQPQPDQHNTLPTDPDTAPNPALETPKVAGDSIKQADNAATGSRLFAENFKPYKDDSLEPLFRGTAGPSPAERFQHLYWDDKHREALLIFESLSETDKNNDNLLFLRANCQLATGRVEEAAILLEQIIRNDRTRFMAEARWYLALSYLKSGKSEQAKNLLRAIGADPGSPRQSDAKRLLGQWK